MAERETVDDVVRDDPDWTLTRTGKATLDSDPRCSIQEDSARDENMPVIVVAEMFMIRARDGSKAKQRAERFAEEITAIERAEAEVRGGG